MRVLILFVICRIGFSSHVVAQDLLLLGDERQLFVDSFLIAQMTDTYLTLHPPINEGAVLHFDLPWEGPFSAYCTIIKDEAKYRLYYRGLPAVDKSDVVDEVTCYAESRDGIIWHKPDLGIVDYKGSKQNNIILAAAGPVTHNFSPFLDLNPNAEPSEKYKAVGGDRKHGLFAYSSADGILWEKMRDTAIFRDGIFDSQNVVFWSESESSYLCYYRTWTGEGYSGFRSVGRASSSDFFHWSAGQQMEFGGRPLEHLYTQQTSPYFRAPQIYIAIGARFMPDRQVLSESDAQTIGVDARYFQDCSDAVLMSSRGGVTFDRTFMESYIRPGIGVENWVSRSNYPALNVVQTGPGVMSIYVNEHYAQSTAHLKRYSLRLDGFASLHAKYQVGKMVTKPFIFSGENLEINFSTSAAGYLKFELQTIEGNPIPQFTLQDIQEIIGNEIFHNVKWKDNPNLGQWAGQPVRLKVEMKDADLFSFRFY